MAVNNFLLTHYIAIMIGLYLQLFRAVWRIVSEGSSYYKINKKPSLLIIRNLRFSLFQVLKYTRTSQHIAKFSMLATDT